MLGRERERENEEYRERARVAIDRVILLLSFSLSLSVPLSNGTLHSGKIPWWKIVKVWSKKPERETNRERERQKLAVK